MHIQTKKRLIAYLNRLGRGVGPLDVAEGLCHLVITDFNWAASEHIKMHFASWKHFSGDKIFPVEGMVRYLNAPRNRWAGKWGKKRRSLCRHIARKLKEEVAKEELKSSSKKLEVLREEARRARRRGH